jgi:hypothetical protein
MGETKMKWTFLLTVVLVFCANFPLLYALKSDGFRLVGDLWGLSPHQFFFCAFVFPFAAFGTMWALELLIRVGLLVPEDTPVRGLFDHWVLMPLAALALACILTGFDYWSGARSLDKLTPAYARTALRAIGEIDERVGELSSDDDIKREWQKVRSAANRAASLKAPSNVEPSVWLASLEAPQRLRVMLDAERQRRLFLLDTDLYVISVFQVAASVGVGITTLFVSALALATMWTGSASGTALISLHKITTLCSVSIAAFAIYMVCYHHYRTNLVKYAGDYGTTYPHVIVGAFCVLALVALSTGTSEASSTLLSAARLAPFVTTVLFAILEGVLFPAMNNLIGTNTNFGTQAVLVIALLTLYGIIFWAIHLIKS